MEAKLNKNKNRSTLNADEVLDRAESAQGHPKPFKKDPYKMLADLEYLTEKTLSSEYDLDDIEESLTVWVDVEKFAQYEKGRLFSLGRIKNSKQFGKWYRKQRFNYQTVYNCISVYEACIEPEWSLTFEKTITIKVASKLSKDIQKDLFECGRPDMKNKDFDRLLDLYKEGKIKRDSPEMQDYLQHKRDKKDHEKRKRVASIHVNSITNFKRTASEIIEFLESGTLPDDDINQATKAKEKIIKLLAKLKPFLENESIEPVFTLPESAKSKT